MLPQGASQVDLEHLSRNLFKKFTSAKENLASLGSASSSTNSGSSAGGAGSNCGKEPCAGGVSTIVHAHPVVVAFRGNPSQQPTSPMAVNPYAIAQQLQQQHAQQQLLQQRAHLLGVGFSSGSSVPMPSTPPASGGNTLSIIPMGPLTAGFTAPLLPGVALQQQLQAQQVRQQQLALLQRMSLSGGGGGSGSSSSRRPSTVSPDAAKDQAETIAKLANLTKAVQVRALCAVLAVEHE